MPTPNEAAHNIRNAVDIFFREGKAGDALKILRNGDYPAVEYPGYAPYVPDYPPVGQAPTATGDDHRPPPPPAPPQIPPGWYTDPFDGVGYRYWNGFGWTGTTTD